MRLRNLVGPCMHMGHTPLGMGFLSRALVPRSIRKPTRAIRHPVRTSIRAATPSEVYTVTHPLAAAEHSILRSLRTGGRRPTQRTQGVSMSAYEREARRAARLEEFEEVRALSEQFRSLGELHLDHFESASPPVASPAEPVDRAALSKAAQRAARAEIPWWKRSERRAASAEAALEADKEANAEEARRETTRQEDQRALDEAWAKLLANEPETTQATISGAFADNAYPAELVGLVDAHALVVMTVAPAEELVPERHPELTPTGRPTTKKNTKTERNGLYRYVLASGLDSYGAGGFCRGPQSRVGDRLSQPQRHLLHADPRGPIRSDFP